MELLLPALAQYGPVGALAGSAITALVYVTRRYIQRLEASEDRWRSAYERSSAAMEELADGQALQVSALNRHEDREQHRHTEVLRLLRARRHPGSVQQQ